MKNRNRRMNLTAVGMTSTLIAIAMPCRPMFGQTCNPDSGPGDTMAPHAGGEGYSMLGKNCQITAWSSGTKCFPMGNAFQCISSTVENGQEVSVSGGVEVGGVGVQVGTTFSTSQSYTCDAAGKKCRFWVCYADSKVWQWRCQRTWGWGWDNSYTEFEPGAATVFACCTPVSCFAGGGEDSAEEVTFAPGAPEGRRSINIDLATHFTPFGMPAPGHPLSGPHSFLPELTEWHFCQIQAITDIASWAGSGPIEEIVVVDAAANPYHFPLDIDPFPFWGDELTQGTSLAVTPGVVCYDEIPAISLASAMARSYDLSSIPGIAGSPYTVNGVVIGIHENTGPDAMGTLNIYADTDGGTPDAPGADLVLLTSKAFLIPGSPDRPHLTIALDAPLVVPADSTIVVEALFPAQTAGVIWPGCNDSPQFGPTYFRSVDCGLPTFVDVATLGFPDSHWVQVVVGESPLPLCPADIAPIGSPDGDVNVDDLLAVINTWGPCADPDNCPADVVPSGGNDNVNVDDLLAVINGWGACP